MVCPLLWLFVHYSPFRNQNNDCPLFFYFFFSLFFFFFTLFFVSMLFWQIQYKEPLFKLMKDLIRVNRRF